MKFFIIRILNIYIYIFTLQFKFKYFFCKKNYLKYFLHLHFIYLKNFQVLEKKKLNYKKKINETKK